MWIITHVLIHGNVSLGPLHLYSVCDVYYYAAYGRIWKYFTEQSVELVSGEAKHWTAD